MQHRRNRVEGKTKRIEVYANVWDAIEDDPTTRENLKLRSELMVALTRHIRRKRLTQAQAAKLLGVTQPRISNLMHGNINVFGLDLLVRMATAADLRVRMSVKKPHKPVHGSSLQVRQSSGRGHPCINHALPGGETSP